MANLSITAANVSGPKGSEITAGATVAAGEVVYEDTAAASNKGKLAEAGDTALKATIKGIALNSAATGQPVGLAVDGNLTVGGGVVTKGVVYALSATAGKICPVDDLVPADYVSEVGVGLDANTIKLNLNNSGIAI